MYRSWNRRTVVSLGSWVGFTGLALLVTVSCAPGLDDSDDLQVAERESALTGYNGVTLNGVTLNGVTLNGVTLNGVTLNGVTLNGVTLNGVTLNGVTLNGVTLNGMPMSAEQQVATDVLVSYMAECALPEGQQITIAGTDGQPRLLNGLFGLAPEWASGPLSKRGERLISACLAARANTQGKHVRISLRGPGVETTPHERAMYTHHEGAFWGNLFSSDPFIHTCTVEGAGISGRDCTDGDCGFQSMGSCATTCSGRDPIDGYYEKCGGEELVLSTFLAVTDDIDFGTAHGCVARDGTAWCWGDNSEGQLGDGTRHSQATAHPVVSDLDAEIIEISSGGQHSCARGSNGALFCWGDNSRGQLGLAITKTRKKRPTAVAQLGRDVASVAAGADHTCALTTDGQAWCWGDNSHGQLGIGGNQNLARSPILVAALGNDVARIAASESSAHTCAMSNEGKLWCWGANSDGQLGDSTRTDRKVPVQIASTRSGAPFGEVTDACTGALHTCARRADGSTWCWGSNDQGQLGNGAFDKARAKRPVRVDLEGEVAQGTLSCGANHTCAILESGSLECWGDNSHGQLGNGTIGNQASVPAPVVGLDGVPVRVSADADRTCAQLDNETTACWGEDIEGWFLGQAGVSAEPISRALFSDN
jgi:alpha-tubulin suppressor-like RCC1 family protein